MIYFKDLWETLIWQGESGVKEKQLCQDALLWADDTNAKYLLWMLSQQDFLL